MKRNILVTGAAGFIGHYTVQALCEQGHRVIGIDNLNDYYDVNLKYARLAVNGINKDYITDLSLVESTIYPEYSFIKTDLTHRTSLEDLFREYRFDIVINLAAQAGVRYSIENPYAYIESNIVGFINLLECCRHFPVSHLVYASSSSVYGMNSKIPFAETDMTDQPVSLYAATKKSNELMAYTYSKLYHIPATGLRFFTVYGPWGRPDMSPSLFMDAVINGKELKIFNHGNMRRDFTYITDIIDGIMKVVFKSPTLPVPHYLYNIGNSEPVDLMEFIKVIEQTAGKEAHKLMLGMQPGDVTCTYADTSRLQHDFNYHPSTSISQGIHEFYNWYISYYCAKQAT